MTVRRLARSLLRNRDGASMVEFALLAPIMIVMLLGILAIGLQMQSYNALRGIAYDVSRRTVVEYQKSNQLTTAQIEQIAASTARSSPYRLSSSQFDASATTALTGMVGARKIVLSLSYTPPRIIKLFNLHPPTITQTESIIVPIAL